MPLIRSPIGSSESISNYTSGLYLELSIIDAYAIKMRESEPGHCSERTQSRLICRKPQR
jgi:hypothetical protein